MAAGFEAQVCCERFADHNLEVESALGAGDVMNLPAGADDVVRQNASLVFDQEGRIFAAFSGIELNVERQRGFGRRFQFHDESI
ncbi:hypothetical protein APY03_0412 [Variovorax sp. WDL1]|nr:hypothetical protein APY03_0412 [Variovorax sp. WDL1]